MCLNETYGRVWVGKYLCDKFPVKNGLKQGDALSSLLFNCAVEQRFPTCAPWSPKGSVEP